MKNKLIIFFILIVVGCAVNNQIIKEPTIRNSEDIYGAYTYESDFDPIEMLKWKVVINEFSKSGNQLYIVVACLLDDIDFVFCLYNRPHLVIFNPLIQRQIQGYSYFRNDVLYQYSWNINTQHYAKHKNTDEDVQTLRKIFDVAQSILDKHENQRI